MRSIHQGQGLRFPCNDRTDEVNKLFIIWPFSAIQKKNIIKNTGSNFQHPLARERGHLRSCSLNRNEPSDMIETTRNSFFDNEIIFVFTTSRSGGKLNHFNFTKHTTCVYKCVTFKKFKS